MTDHYENDHLLLSAEELHNLLQEEDISRLIIDARGPDLWSEETIPTALPVSVTDLNEPQTIAGYIVDPENFSAKLAELGLNDDSRVIVFDDGYDRKAGRLFWALEYYGLYDRVQILDGGFTAWKKRGFPVEKQPTFASRSIQRGNFRARPERQRIVLAEELTPEQKERDLQIFDVRTTEEYTGELVRAKEGGHIPGALHLEWKEVLAEDQYSPRWKAAHDIKALYDEIGLDKHKPVATYCQGNIRAAHAYFTLRLLGYKPRAYEGSWAEWGNREDLPKEK